MLASVALDEGIIEGASATVEISTLSGSLVLFVGSKDGTLDGPALGATDGLAEGNVLGLVDGDTLGPKDGAVDGPDEGKLVGLIDKLGPLLA